MCLSVVTTTAMMVPSSYFHSEIPPRTRYQVVFPNAAPFAGRTRAEVKSGSRVVVQGSVDPNPQLPSDSSDPWRKWFLGGTVATILSFFSSKWGPLMKIKNEVEKTVDKAEQVTEMVKNVAEEVEKVAKEVEVDLPEGGKLREAVVKVDEVVKTTFKDAELVEDVLEKVERVEKDVDSIMDADDNHNPPSDAAKGA